MEKIENSNTQIDTLPENEKLNQPSNMKLPLKKRKKKNRKLAGW